MTELARSIEQIDMRLRELREHSGLDNPFDWDDVEYLRLLSEKLRLGYATGFNHVWFAQMAEKLNLTLQALDSRDDQLKAIHEIVTERA